MGRINTSSWSRFRLGDLFDVEKGKRLTKTDMKPGNINYIGATAFNNGVTAKIGNDEFLHPAGTITVCYNGSVGQSFYQTERFWATDDVNVLYPKFPMTLQIALFIIPLLRKIGSQYAYVDKWTQDKMEETMLPLPAVSGHPDWDYMEQYIKELTEKTQRQLGTLVEYGSHSRCPIDLQNFKRFYLYDENLFIIDSGTKLDKVKMSIKNPSVNFVGRANANNGVTDFIDSIDGIKPYKAGYLTVSLGGEYLGSCFVQEKDFYTSQNVNVLIPRHDMSDNCKQYIATMIFREGRLHYKAFIDELNRHMKTDFSIPLPITCTGKIDWDYMETKMSEIKVRVQKNIECLSNID